MKHATMMRVLAALYLFGLLRKGSRLMLSDVAFWSQIPRMTTYRYLNKMIDKGLVETVPTKFRGNEVTGYLLTDTGYQYFCEIQD